MKFNELTTEIINYRKDVTSNQDELSETQRGLIDYALDTKQNIQLFKQKHFVGQGQITPYGAIKQYLLELRTRESAIHDMEYHLSIIDLEIAELEDKLSATDSAFEKRRCEIEIKYRKGKRAGFVHNIRNNRLERKQYVEAVEELNAQYKLENGMTLLEALRDPETSETLERDYWVKRMGKQAAMDMIAYGRVGAGNMDSLTMLSKEDQRKALELASEVLVWNENRMQHILSDANTKFQQLERSELADLLKLTKE